MQEKTKYVYRMSGVGHCTRALSAERLGREKEPEPEWLQRTAEEGKWHEQRIKNELRADDIAVVAEQAEFTIEFPDFLLQGHIDGMVHDHSDKPKLLEIKSMSQFEFDRWMRGSFDEFPQYAYQTTCYMQATHLNECLYIVKNRNNGYEDKRNIAEQPVDFIEVIRNLNKIEDFASRGDLVEAEYNADSLQCRRCFYKQLCIPPKKELTQQTEAELLEATRSWREGDKLIKAGKALVDSAKTVFMSQSVASNAKSFQFDGLAVIHKEYDVKEYMVKAQHKNYIEVSDIRKKES